MMGTLFSNHRRTARRIALTACLTTSGAVAALVPAAMASAAPLPTDPCPGGNVCVAQTQYPQVSVSASTRGSEAEALAIAQNAAENQCAAGASINNEWYRESYGVASDGLSFATVTGRCQ